MAMGQLTAGTERTTGTAMGRSEGTEGTERKVCRRRQEGMGKTLTAKEEDPYPAA